ncbi:MAG: ATP-binding cassette domain-containing protein [Deltaproteobacteria bacterium]|nr:ATP-binding cassette domain-containing protein [Deltaproteobacteria bacterium]
MSFVNVALPSGAQEGLLLYGLDEFERWNFPWKVLEGRLEDLRRGRYLFLDQSAERRFGPFQVGEYREVQGQRMKIIGRTADALSFTTTPIAFADFRQAQSFNAEIMSGKAHYIVVRLATGADAEAVRAEIRRRLPFNDVYTGAEWAAHSRAYWVENTGLGINLSVTVFLGCLVGVVVVAQTLYTSTMEHLKEFGTVKAIGGSNADIYRILAVQAVIAACAGFLLGARPVVRLGVAGGEARAAAHHPTGFRRDRVRGHRGALPGGVAGVVPQGRVDRPGAGVPRLSGRGEDPVAVLEAVDVTKVFAEGRERVEVLKGVSLAIEPGEIVALEGPSGSGKTTLLSILGCILTPTSGTVVVDGEVVDAARPARLPAIRRRSIGFVFQQFNLFPALTALENVEYALNLKGLRDADARAEAERVIEAVGLADRRGFLPRDLSGGQKQRVAVARALAGRPAVLLADEPTANLDSHVGGQILDMFQRLAKQEGRAALIVTHDPKVRRIVDRVVQIRDGELFPVVDDEATYGLGRRAGEAHAEVRSA